MKILFILLILSVLYISCVASVRLICQFEEFAKSYGNGASDAISWVFDCTHDGHNSEGGSISFDSNLFNPHKCGGEHYTEHGGYSIEPISGDCGNMVLRLKWDGKTCESGMYHVQAGQKCYWHRSDEDKCHTWAHVCDV